MVAWNDTFSQCGVPDSDGSISPDVIEGFDFTKRSEEARGGSVVNFGVSGFRELPDASPLRRRSAAPLNRNDPETQLYYVRNRMYNPALGRWVQRDPIGYSGGINLYEYVGGRAAGNRDALGLQSGSLPGGNPFQGAWTGLGDFLSTPAGQAALNKLYGFGLGHLTPTGPDTGPGLPAAPKPGGGVSFCPYQTKFPGGGFRINIGSGFGYSWPFNVNASPYINGVVNYGALYAWLQAQGMGSYQGGSFNTGGNVSGGVGWGSLYIAGSTGTGGNVLVGGLSFGF
jgi:RHS repeat-associated protein